MAELQMRSHSGATARSAERALEHARIPGQAATETASEDEVGTFNRRGLAPVTVGRLVRCYHLCAQLQDEGTEVTFSREIGQRLGCSPSLVRKDLSRLGRLGTRGSGYRVAELKTVLGQALGIGKARNAILVGGGGLGTALLNSWGFERQGFRFTAVFDADPKKIGTPRGSLMVKHVSEIPRALRSSGAEIGVLAVPATEAQRTAELLVNNGVHAILNFTCAALSLNGSVVVSNVDLAVEMEKLAFYLADTEGAASERSGITDRRETQAAVRGAKLKMEARILVADDEPDMLRGLERALLCEGYEVEPAKDGIEAAEKLKAKRFDVVVSDLRMPTVDGMDLLHMAKRKDRDVVFIMITAYATPGNVAEATKLGSYDYISKPFAPSDLVEAIERGLHERAPGS